MEYIKNNITNSTYQFKDRQSDGKSNDEPLSKFLRAIITFSERISNKVETYLYLFMWLCKWCDLPSHTDRKECEYTVSFLIERYRVANIFA